MPSSQTIEAKDGGETAVRNHSIIIALLIVFLLGCLCLYRESECQEHDGTKDAIHALRLFPTGIGSRLPSFVSEGASWPDEKAIEEKRAGTHLPKVRRSIESTIDWLRRIIDPERLPQDIEQRLLPLGGSLGGDDAIWTRYQVDGYLMQIVVDFGIIRLFISPFENKNTVSSKDREGMRSLVLRVVDGFFRDSDSVKRKLPGVQLDRGVAFGIPEGEIERAPNLWWEQVRWWSDGKTIAFWIPKTDERTAIEQPTRVKHWFSSP